MWQLIFTGLDGTPIGEFTNAHDRRLTFAHNRPQTIGMTIELTDPLMPELFSRQRGLIKAYRDGGLKMVAELTSIDAVGTRDEHSVAIVATDAIWQRLPKRLIGKSTTGYSATLDPTTMISLLLSQVNGEAPTGITQGTITSIGQTVTAGPWYYKPLMEAITELGDTANGFDFWVTPVEPGSASLSGTIGKLNMAALRGAQRTEAIFEYGTGRVNAREWGLSVDNTANLTRAYALPADFPDNAGLTVATYEDTTATAAELLREEIVSSDLSSAALRALLCQEHVLARRYGEQIFRIQPDIDDGTDRVPTFTVDYDIGDTIEGRVKDQGTVVLDALVRVYQADVALDDNGLEEITLSLIQEAS